jgi:hypothetical protein
MNLEFKNLHAPQSKGSRLLYTAMVVLDGEPCFTAKNTGTGSDHYKALPGKEEKLKAFMEWARVKKHTTAEAYIHAAVERELGRRELGKLLKTHALYVEPNGDVNRIKIHDSESLAMTKHYLKSKKPKARLLNEMDGPEALDVWMAGKSKKKRK